VPGTDGADLVSQLVALGLTRNEALAWLTLLEDEGDQGLTGYEVASRSGIPRSAVYSTLRKLETHGGAFATGSEPVRYLPTDPRTFVAENRRTALARLDALAESLASLPKRVRPEPVWVLQRYGEVMSRIDTLIRGATASVYVSLWPREVEVLWPALCAVSSRGLHSVLHSPGRLERTPPGFSCWIDDLVGDTDKATWSHKALVIVDHTQAIIGGTEPSADNQAVWTTNPSLVDLAVDNIVLDITRLAEKSDRSCGEVVAPMMRPHLR
jgi:HTH-type transcriptional regulator, sugar sensing transcriptional regulator